MIRIVTDASVNLPAEIVEAFRIVLVPAYIIFGGTQYREGLDITTAEVIARLENGDAFPTTSQPTPADFERAYRAILDEDPGATILSVHLTGAGSGIIDSARQAAAALRAALPSAAVHVFDTRAFSITQALMVREAALMARAGEAVESILARLGEMRDCAKTYFVLDTLDYVYRGGRIGRAAHLIGSLLNIKPVLTVRDGVMEAHARFRTFSQAVASLRDLALAAGEGARGLQLAVGYVLHDAQARALADELAARLSPDVLLVSEVGPALGVHTGPGALGIAWFAPPAG